jgi:hypothetical protein
MSRKWNPLSFTAATPLSLSLSLSLPLFGALCLIKEDLDLMKQVSKKTDPSL